MFYCSNCKSDNVQMKAWVHANSLEFEEWDSSEDTGWCESCGTFSEIKYRPDRHLDEPVVNDREPDNTEGSND